MTDAREIIAQFLCTMAAQGWSAISPFERAAYRTTAAGMVEAVTTDGFRILGPGELDAETVERCIKELNKLPWFEDVVSLVDVEDALRALASGESR